MVQPVWGIPAPSKEYNLPAAKPVHTQATTFAAPFQNTTRRGWWQPLSVAAPVAKAQLGSSFVPFNKVQIASNPLGWQQALSGAPSVAIARQGNSFVPFNTKQISNSPLNCFQPLFGAPPVAQAQQGYVFVPLNTPQIATTASNPWGWQQGLSRPLVTPVVNNSAPTFIIQPFAVPSGWQNQLSSAVSIPKAQAGSYFVPLSSVQVAATPPPNGWFGPISPAANVAIAQPTQATTFAIPTQISNSISQFGWYYPLSQPTPVAQAQQGYTFVPFNTVQMLPQIIPLFYDAGVPRTATVYYQALFNPLSPIVQTSNTVTQVSWQQPLSVAVPTNKTVQTQTFVPFNTIQVTAVTSQGWWQPLSAAVNTVTANYTQPIWVLGAFQTPSLAWLQPLSQAVPVANSQSGYSFVPFNTAQVQPAGISGMAWYTPLGTVAKSIPTATQGISFVPLDTAQLVPPPDLLTHYLPFLVTIGKLKSF